MKTFWIVVVVCLTLCGCNNEPSLARVGDRSVSNAEFEAFLAYKRIPKTDGDKVAKALESYLQREALAAAIEKEGKVNAAAIEAEARELKKDALIQRHLEAYLDKAVSDEAVRNYYEAHVAEYQERKVHVAHMLFRTPRGMTDGERAQKRTLATEVATKLRSGGDFAQLAQELSDDKVSARRGGDIGWIKEGGVHKTFSDTAFGLEPGKFSDPVETPFGYHVIKLVEGPSEIKRPLEAVRGDIRHKLRADAKSAETNRLQKLAKIERTGELPATKSSVAAANATR